MKVGIFDSGIGGLSVLHEAFHQLTDLEYVFYGDTDHVPYGLKTKEEIMGYSDQIVAFLMDQGVDAVLIACNTASSVAAAFLREKYDLPILAMEPAVRPAVLDPARNRVLVTATPVTIREKKLHDLIEREGVEEIIDLLPLPQLVTFAEGEEFDSPEVYSYLENVLKGYNLEDYSAVVLGCTHFNYFKPALKRIFGPETHLVDGAPGTIRYLGKRLGVEVKNQSAWEDSESILFENGADMMKRFKISYFTSGVPVVDSEKLDYLARMHNQLERALRA